MSKYAHVLFMSGLVLTFVSCGKPENREFEALANRYIEKFLEMNPSWATYLGDHRYDHRLDDLSADGVAQSLQLHKSYLDSLNRVDVSALSQDNAIDYQILKNHIEYWIYDIEVLKGHEWNPMTYNVGNFVYSLIARDFALLPERLANVMERLKEIPGFLEIAKTNLKNPPKIHTETSILQNKGNISMIRDQLNEFLDQVPELRKEFAAVQKEAVLALEAYGKWLEQELLPQAKGDFRLGDDKRIG